MIVLAFLVYQVGAVLAGQKLDLHPYLDTLQFRNGPSFVHANQRFGWEQFCVLYSEPENVSTIRFGWDSLGLRSYLFENPGNQKKQRSPPGGMRSAVPLGGLGTGSFELRGDGSIHEWTIENQTPAGSAKLNQAALDLAVFGVRVHTGASNTALLMRTHPPKGYPGVASLGYSGSYPVSKLTIRDKRFGDVKLDLFAFSALKPRDSKTSATPAIAFTLRIKNPTKKSIKVSFMLNLPLGIQTDTKRYGKPTKSFKVSNSDPTSCSKTCVDDLECLSWQVDVKNKTCLLFDQVPPHAWQQGTISGQKNAWTACDSVLTLNRPGKYPQSGNTSIATDKEDNPSFMVSNGFRQIWKQFSQHGYLRSTEKSFGAGFHGAASVNITVRPGKENTLTMVLGWFYPNRDFTVENVGNYYSNIFKSSQEAALHMSRDLASTVQVISSWHSSMILNNTTDSVQTLPKWLQDVLVNGLSFWRTGLYLRDGRWRQFEALDCIDMDSVHNDFQREIPYVLFYPDLVKNVMRAWAKYQSKDGHIVETLAAGCYSRTRKIDSGPAIQRLMGDVTTVFVVETYHIYLWTNDSEFLRDMWPHVVKAVDWMIFKGTQGTGLPYKLQCTYDQLDLNLYDHNIFNSFLYVLALRAAQELCNIMDDHSLWKEVTIAMEFARYTISEELWSEEDGYYHAWWDKQKGSASWLMSDSLYAQVWAYTLGLGHLDEPNRLRSHLMKELEINDTPYGLRVMATDPPTNKSVGSCPKDISTAQLNNRVALHESIWIGSSPDWTTLQIHLGFDAQDALQQAKKAINHVRSGLNDQWNFHGLYSGTGYGLDGLPWCTSHYTFHMVLWHIPFALSGQSFSAPNATLSFDPKLPCPYKVPFYTPFATGTLQCTFLHIPHRKNQETKKFEILSTSGDISLQVLEVSGFQYPSAITIKQGKEVTWCSN
ncbi:uncharacterized protein LOC110063277 isoform X1 [Orbicella faveolata]|uniref:uncharacterized protein LOC110063277 isoform X1 n=1 Tax=Orbicella faveolata TaxID=48498 RepID=UPI0009E5E6D3|nr:uncharacterized protein LOC110063277 isoform X1 [Orbicella faveolata]